MRMQRVVIKVGTNVITKESGLLDREIMLSIVDQVIALKCQGIEVILVSSGSVAAGRSCLGLESCQSKILFERQVLASVGQVKLMGIYSELFLEKGYHCAQVLATKEDFRDRHHYLCMRNCFQVLLRDNIIPIVNENDVVAVSELMFTDNDELAGLIASMSNVDTLFILTSVDGLFDRHPQDGQAQLIRRVSADTHQLDKYASPSSKGSTFGRGGMHTKCRVAKQLSSLGIITHIVNGRVPGIILEVLKGKHFGTVFEVQKQKQVSGIKKWIAHSKGQEKGRVFLNECAELLLKSNDRARSLLPVGITEVSGNFSKGDIIEVLDSKGGVMGYGLAQYGSESVREKLGEKNKKPLIHYDYLFLYP